ncbi:hypothetical protein C499_12985 [Halogeometricum borinquense DSM 11551]|uniref:DUF7982 domain-containing protein n=1 Tax=Halogeometricum borinquense (strain ATCC 700274 / DSM 11551 / JCM 10706 / KCTC 4070 / PR3) TaxID=469382 RepID=E4NUE2_HALBP|nr:hypothetical protein [Halogeometricum borinquense]ADQ68662.1 hypothetical protein Hbor_31270 [Halogeometricum borinquense DSM 11551]ELY25402.1 hypothetical protein C499_12985 [Halogeometricum borinquense DSM 11551]
MSSVTETDVDDESPLHDESPADRETLRGRIEVLREENRRLREEYLRARQAQYRRTAIGMAAIGLCALAGAAVLPALRTTLLVLAGTGGFGASLLYYLTPDQLVPVSVGQSVFTAHDRHASSLVDELGLQDTTVYVPRVRDQEAVSPEQIRLFIPQARGWELPSDDALAATFVEPDDEMRRGISLEPTGVSLLSEFADAANTNPSEPADLADQLCEAVVEQFELSTYADAEVDTATNRVSVRAGHSAYGELTAFDHPLVSVIGVGLARGLGASVETESVESVDSDEYLISYRYRTIDSASTKQG